MRKVTKIDKETEEPYERYVWNSDEGKDYSDFREADALLLKLAERVEKLYPEEFQMWLGIGQKKRDFADFIIMKLPAEGVNAINGNQENSNEESNEDSNDAGC